MANSQSENETVEQLCPNCNATLYGQFCFHCGQNQRSIDRHFFTLINEFFDEVFAPNSKAARTLLYLSFKPGLLTREYFSGRKASYIQPVRLYLTTSILFFFFISVSNLGEINLTDENQQPIVIEQDDSIVVDVEWPGLSAEDSGHLNERLNTQLSKAIELLEQNPNLARDMVIDNAPPVIFFLVPLFALLLKLIYFNKGRFYTEHLVLALHNHSFVFLALLVEAITNMLPLSAIIEWLQSLIDFWIVIYLFLSLKNTFGDGWISTGFKFLILGVLYWSLFLMIAATAAVVGVMTL